jgi:hypothetical protein
MKNIVHDLVEFCSWEGVSIKVESHNPSALLLPSFEELELKELLEQYCICEELYPPPVKMLTKDHSQREFLNEQRKQKKKLILEKINFENTLKKLIWDLTMISGLSSEIISGRSKSCRGSDDSVRRSKYIGVSRNGPHWQALIAIKKRKTYIGTYDNQEDAARAFDFYSLLLHSLTAKTNFNYTKGEVLEMIEKFRDPANNNSF